MEAALKSRNLVILLASFLMSGCNGLHWNPEPIDETYEGLYSIIQNVKRNNCLSHSVTPGGCSDNDALPYREYKKMREKTTRGY